MKRRNSTSCTKKTRPEIVLIIKLAKGEEEEEEEKGEKEGGARVCAGRNVLCNVGQGKPAAACLS